MSDVESLDSLTLMPEGAPLPAAGTWPLGVPRSVLDHQRAARLALERVEGAGGMHRYHPSGFGALAREGDPGTGIPAAPDPRHLAELAGRTSRIVHRSESPEPGTGHPGDQ